ncbi:MAG: Hsp20/alpha crystallin family protein [Deinococcus sp.]|nr:Hsp20/alpha crystallin family protein [Deinococcus sp.]
MPRDLWDPTSVLSNIRRELDRFLEEPYASVPGQQGWSPPVDIFETEQSLVIRAELPGVQQKDIEITVQDGTLALKGKKDLSPDVRREQYHRMERTYGPFQRSFALPPNVNQEKVSAKFAGGVLEITLPKSEKAISHQVRVETQ